MERELVFLKGWPFMMFMRELRTVTDGKEML